eukprot:scaffold100138_cov39-Phaeocystis_antarctica.AAC.1
MDARAATSRGVFTTQRHRSCRYRTALSTCLHSASFIPPSRSCRAATSFSVWPRPNHDLRLLSGRSAVVRCGSFPGATCTFVCRPPRRCCCAASSAPVSVHTGTPMTADWPVTGLVLSGAGVGDVATRGRELLDMEFERARGRADCGDFETGGRFRPQRGATEDADFFECCSHKSLRPSGPSA